MGRNLGEPPAVRCCACNAERHHVHFIKDGYSILRCNCCGLGWVDPESVSAEAVSSIYDSEYFSGGRSDGYADYAASESVLRHEFQRTVQDIRHRKSGGRLVEIGCAYGFFLLEASPYFECSGLELSPAAVEACHQRALDVRRGPADESHIKPLGEADVVVMLDVIEHLPDPAATLASVWALLKPGGMLVITTGDWSSLLARVMGKRWRLMTPPQHLFYFTARSLQKLCQRVGFTQFESTAPWKLVPLELIWYQLRRYLPLPQLPLGGRLAKLGIYINLFDTIRFIAYKPGHAVG